MNDNVCSHCGWFDPEKNGRAFCPVKECVVYAGKQACEYLELTGGVEQCQSK